MRINTKIKTEIKAKTNKKIKKIKKLKKNKKIKKDEKNIWYETHFFGILRFTCVETCISI